MPLPQRQKAKKSPKPRRARSSAEAVPSESDEQIWFFKWVRLALPKLLAWHTPNGGKRSLKTAVRMKHEGVTPGVPDISIMKRRGPYAGMFIEMKRRKGGALSEGQKQIIAELREEGYYVAVCKGWEEARDALLKYLSFGEPQWIR
jgi:VRR-NUC domain